MAGIWTRNYFNMLTAAYLANDRTSSTATPADYTPPIRIRKPNGGYTSIASLSGTTPYGSDDGTPRIALASIGKTTVTKVTDETYIIPVSATSSYFGLSLGSGNNPATFDDYKLQSILTTGYSLPVTGSLTESSTLTPDHHIKSKISFTATNNSAGNITVGEIGLYLPYESGNTPHFCLVYRDAFDEVITLEPGESLIISFSRDGEIYNYHPYPG